MPLPSEPEFRVTRRTQPAPPDERLSAAWGALLHGDPAAAKGRYAEVLTTDPENRQALLAMAAIESRAGETVRARRYYLRLLQRDPTDPLALAGLLDGEPAADPLMRESRLKQLIARHPDLAVLHSALGSHYAREQRWLDARRAYEQAANIEGTLGARHPDTIFNLAVALDHLGRRREALARYQEALNGARRIPSGFEPGTAEARVRALSES